MRSFMESVYVVLDYVGVQSMSLFLYNYVINSNIHAHFPIHFLFLLHPTHFPFLL